MDAPSSTAAVTATTSWLVSIFDAVASRPAAFVRTSSSFTRETEATRVSKTAEIAARARASAEPRSSATPTPVTKRSGGNWAEAPATQSGGAAPRRVESRSAMIMVSRPSARGSRS
jgi:hypothetical protein